MHMVGLSILSGSHMELVESVLQELRSRDLANVPVIAGDHPAGGCREAQGTGRARDLYAQGFQSEYDHGGYGGRDP